jgi:small subunit ribosomal protein S13
MAEKAFKHIVRIAQVDVSGDKPIKIALKKIKGVGFNLASAACNLANISQNQKAGELTDEQVKKLNEIISNPQEKGIPLWMLNRRKDYETGKDTHLLMGTLDYTKDNTIKRLRKIKSYKGTRHSQGLPVRGQRTKANFRRSKGKVVGVAKKKGAKTGRP